MYCNQYIQNATHVVNDSPSYLLDHFYSNKDASHISSHILIHDISDHLSIVTITKDTKPLQQFCNKYKRDTKHFVAEEFLIDLDQQLNHIFLSKNSNLHDDMENCINKFTMVLNKHAPLRKSTRKKKRLAAKPWITKGILTSIKIKNKIYKELLTNNTTQQKTIFKIYRNKLTHIKEQAKKLYFNQQIKESQHNTGLLWKTINNIISLKKIKAQNDINIMNEEGNFIANPLQKSNYFNNYFVSLGENMANKIHQPSSSCPFTETSLLHSSPNSFFLKPISIEEVLIELNNIDPAKSSNSDNPPNKYIKLAASTIAPTLTFLYNKCITTSTFPNNFKISEIKPLFKQGNKHICTNYRPISLISSFSKIFEKCLFKQLYSYLCKYNLLYKFQYGFRENYSTEFAVSQVCNDIIENLKNKSITCSVFLDLAKAFDTVNHQILLKKLSKYGIRGKPLKLFKSYLLNRKQSTVVNNVKSEWCTVKCGVPQGSTLGPLLFLIYINDLHQATKLNVKLFADDAVLSLSNKIPNSLQFDINLELLKVENWMRINKLTINYKKTNYMILTKKN